jgi:hypothetical protein
MGIASLHPSYVLPDGQITGMNRSNKSHSRKHKLTWASPMRHSRKRGFHEEHALGRDPRAVADSMTGISANYQGPWRADRRRGAGKIVDYLAATC